MGRISAPMLHPFRAEQDLPLWTKFRETSGVLSLIMKELCCGQRSQQVKGPSEDISNNVDNLQFKKIC